MTDGQDNYAVNPDEIKRSFEQLFLDEQRYILAALIREGSLRGDATDVKRSQPDLGGSSSEDAISGAGGDKAEFARSFGSIAPPAIGSAVRDAADRVSDAYKEQIRGMVRTFGGYPEAIYDQSAEPKPADKSAGEEGTGQAVELAPEAEPRADGDAVSRAQGIEPEVPAEEETPSPAEPAPDHSIDRDRLRLVGVRDKNDEPFVSFLADDQAGLAFSGGGIRSATFNLGVLQGLNDLGLLPMFDYLSTVSGGGYVGGWWTAWRHRGTESKDFHFPRPAPIPNDPHPIKNREPEEIRHLREFSNFLTPRFGIFSTDMWNGVVSIISGMLPALLMAISLLFVMITAFIVVGFLLLTPHVVKVFGAPLPIVAMLSMATLTGVVLFSLERSWRNKYHALKTEEFAKGFHRVNAGFATFAAAMLLASASLYGGLIYVQSNEDLGVPQVLSVIDAIELHSQRMQGVTASPESKNGVEEIVTAPEPVTAGAGASAEEDSRRLELGPGVDLVIGPARPSILFQVNRALFLPSAAWLLTCLVMLLLRYWASWSSDVAANRKRLSASSRVLGRLGKAAVVWAMFAGIWELSRYLEIALPTFTYWMGGGLALGLELFRRSTGVLAHSASTSETPGIVSSISSLLPQILAYLILVVSLLLLCQVARILLANGVQWLIVVACVAALVIVAECWMVNPEALGLHAFYRDRLARGYLGASNPELRDGTVTRAAKNRQTMPHERDDFRFRDVIATQNDDGTENAAKPLRPFHLVCCAANDIATDHVTDLGRGSRSATLSGLGLAVGNHVATQKGLTLATAMTASAAAFNSNMGSVSMKLGPVVTFLLAAINLRLGLWLRHPASKKWCDAPTFPGARLLTEMLSGTSAGFLGNELQSDDVHLSDGNHFENLALYELIRRHCRYILVSDCGADPEVAFDDLGNALRRIREDFAVEIEIDVKQLIAGEDGLAKQHVAVGTIHYDRKNDKGILLYFKPNLTGDEPDDVTQYKTRNEQFPNETTADQFYDEAQWESYRRLGEHAARSALRFCENYSDESKRTAQQVFCDAFQKYFPAPDDLQASVTLHSKRFSKFQQRLRGESTRHSRLVTEICPELRVFKTSEPVSDEIPLQEEQRSLLILLTEMTQVMEDAFGGCRLATHANHPLNLGWINLFERWGNTPTFRSWWPILQPLYGDDFRKFMNREVGLSDRAAWRDDR